MMKLYLSRKTHVLMLTILYVSQVITTYSYYLYTSIAGIIVSTIILVLYLNYAKLHVSSAEIYALFHLLSLIIVSAVAISLVIQILLNQLTLYTTLYSATLILSITLVNLIIMGLHRRR
uniref:Uncharacterized protein n=2 Tax=Staphylothermus marinus TaxID=2280 RepID=A0A7C4JLJ8_STAMA